MDRKSLLAVLLEIQEKFPNARDEARDNVTIEQVVKEFTRDLQKETLHETDIANAWMEPRYSLLEHRNEVLVWDDEMPHYPLMAFEFGP